MHKFKTKWFSILKKIYKKFPQSSRKNILIFFRKIGFSNENFYQELKFSGNFKVKINNDKSFQMVNYGGYMELEIFWNGLFTTWENDTGWLWLELCEFSNVILDVGANNGIYSLVAKTINPGSEVYAFEPSMYTYKKLVRNNELNNFNIRCINAAISNRTGQQVLYDIPKNNQTNASLSPDKMKNFKGYRGEILEYTVPTFSLSDFIQENSLSNVDLIKIDIELHEPEAIEGLGNYLINYKPILIIEVLTEEIAMRLNKLINFDEFKLFHLRKGYKAQSLSKFKTTEEALANWEWNYILFHKDLEEKLKTKTSLYKNLI